jgi:hypothetical protein
MTTKSAGTTSSKLIVSQKLTTTELWSMKFASLNHTAMDLLLLPKVTSSSDLVSKIEPPNNLCPVNERSVATDDSYFARENGQIVDVDFSHIKLFRNQTLHKLIEQTPDYNFKLPGARSKLKSQDSKQKSSLQ